MLGLGTLTLTIGGVLASQGELTAAVTAYGEAVEARARVRASVRACVLPCVRASVCACVRVVLRACVLACLRACLYLATLTLTP